MIATRKTKRKKEKMENFLRKLERTSKNHILYASPFEIAASAPVSGRLSQKRLLTGALILEMDTSGGTSSSRNVSHAISSKGSGATSDFSQFLSHLNGGGGGGGSKHSHDDIDRREQRTASLEMKRRSSDSDGILFNNYCYSGHGDISKMSDKDGHMSHSVPSIHAPNDTHSLSIHSLSIHPLSIHPPITHLPNSAVPPPPPPPPEADDADAWRSRTRHAASTAPFRISLSASSKYTKMWSRMNSRSLIPPKSNVPNVCNASLISAFPCNSPCEIAATKAWNLT
mmetsp:Transcript_17381/g.31754  ORF Transcript_17381/g.31754 Transcript_17381/m.31754 type:complete len:284 (+) Transcript_17381:201-1052(+)